jgi:hypothetical protein
MKGRVSADEERLSSLFQEVVANGKVYQGGGGQVEAPTFRESVELAAQRSLVRLFPKFGAADNPHWGKVVTKAREGAPDSLQSVGYAGDVPSHPVCKEVLSAITAGGTKGSEVRSRFSSPPYGWDEDAIRGALLALLATRHIRAAQDGVNLTGPKQLEPRQIAKTTFYKEDEPPIMKQRMAVRGLLTVAGIPYENSQEQAQLPALLQKLLDLATGAGGSPPLPTQPDTTHIASFQSLAGNQQFRAIADDHDRLRNNLEDWRNAFQRRDERQKEWVILEALLHHGRDLSIAVEISKQRDAVREGRQLLADPNPVQPLLETITGPLRTRLQTAAELLRTQYDEVMEELKSCNEWQRIGPNDRERILNIVGLQPPADIDVSTRDRLLTVLNDAPLDGWKDKIEVVRARAKRAREEATKLLEPTAVRVSIDSATLKTETDANAYLEKMRKKIMQHITDGHTVVI